MRKHHPRNTSQNAKGSRHRILPVWNKTFDENAFARALLLLAMHLDENDKMAHTNGNAQQASEKGGEDHE